MTRPRSGPVTYLPTPGRPDAPIPPDALDTDIDARDLDNVRTVGESRYAEALTRVAKVIYGVNPPTGMQGGDIWYPAPTVKQLRKERRRLRRRVKALTREINERERGTE